AAVSPTPTRAQVASAESTVENAYPTHLVFHLDATSDSEITDVTLRYSIKGRGASGIGKPADFAPATSVSLAVEVAVNSGNDYIPVASAFVYRCEITTAAGEVTETEDQEFLYLPPDQEWLDVENDVMRVYYHGDRESLAQEF